MTAKKPTLCVFCGGDKSLGQMNKEHFVPKCLWANNRPAHTKTVPAHEKCNSALAMDNEYFRDVLVIEAGAGAHPEVEKLRSGEFERKLRKKPGEISSLLANVKLLPQVTPNGIYAGHSLAVRVDRERIDRVLYNVMRGVFYLVNREPMPLDWEWGISRQEEIPSDALLDIAEQMGPAWHTFGDDVFACRYIFDYDKGAMQCFMRFYGGRIYIGGAYSESCMRTAMLDFQESFKPD